MPNQLKLPFACEVTPSEADLRAVFARTSLPMSFGRALSLPAVALCLTAAARAHITARRSAGRRR